MAGILLPITKILKADWYVPWVSEEDWLPSFNHAMSKLGQGNVKGIAGKEIPNRIAVRLQVIRFIMRLLGKHSQF
jgi:hypothetical protein